MEQKTVVILVHGFNVVNPEKTVGKFRPYCEKLGAVVEMFTYGYVPHPWQITKRNPILAAKLAARCQHWAMMGYRVYLVVHSNGAAIAKLAADDHNAIIDRVLAIHPALRQELNPCATAEKIYIIYNSGDKAVVAGRLLGRISKYLFPKSWAFRPWGKMGKYGYQGDDDGRISNYDSGNSRYFVPAVSGHSAEFAKGAAEQILPELTRLLIRDARILRAGNSQYMPPLEGSKI